MKNLFMLMFVGCISIFNSCRKDGPVGPQGPAGNANVMGEYPFTVNAGSWTFTTNIAGNTGNAYVVSYNDANITSSVANHGLVVMYIQYADGTWKSLPDIFAGTSFSFNFSAGGFDIYYTNVDGTTPSSPGTQVFRAVVIPSSIRQIHPNTNWNNYNEAMTVMHSAN